MSRESDPGTSVPFEAIDATAELQNRPRRPADPAGEAQALSALARVMTQSPELVLANLAEQALGLCRAHSAGVSLLEEVDGRPVFRWKAVAGRIASYVGGTLPGDFSPCRAVFDRGDALLMSRPARHFMAMPPIDPPGVEILMVPFFRGDLPIGTVWAISHDELRRFDAEDARVLTDLSRFASAAVLNLQLLEDSRRAQSELSRLREEEKAANGRAIQILESISDAFFAVDRSWRFTYLNPQAERQLLREPDALLGKALWDEFPLALGTRFESEYRSSMDTGAPVTFEEYYPAPLDTWFEVHGYPSPEGLSVYFRNVNERKRGEEALREEGRRKDEFLAMLAHELRNPLAAVSNATRLLKVGTDEAHRDWAVGVIGRQVGNLTRLINDLLDVSRINRGLVELHPRPMELQSTILRAVETVRPLIDQRDHRLTLRLTDEPLWVMGDPTRLEQVIGNLLTNSAKYTDPGGEIMVEAATDGAEHRVRVRDNGRGIATDLLPRIFDLFTQGDRSIARSEGGLGIGLTVVKNLVELHGGRVVPRSDGPGAGSEFVVHLPAREADPADSLTAPAAPPESRCTLRILVVDDLADSAVGLAQLLRHQSHEVATAHDGGEALSTARDFRPDAVLLDLGLPGVDGFEVARRLRAEFPKGLQLIAVSGYGQPEHRRRSREAGFDHHLLKPVDLDELTRLLSIPRGPSGP